VAVAACVGDHPLLQVLGLADIEYVALCIDHAVDAGTGGREAREVENRLATARNGIGLGRQLGQAVAVDLDRQRRFLGFRLVLFVRLDCRVDVPPLPVHGRKIRIRGAPGQRRPGRHQMAAVPPPPGHCRARQQRFVSHRRRDRGGTVRR